MRVEKPEISGSSTDRFSCGVFAVLVTPCDHRGPMGLVGEASPDKWGSLHRVHDLDEGVMIFRPSSLANALKCGRFGLCR